jgi:hypothetical protein
MTADAVKAYARRHGADLIGVEACKLRAIQPDQRASGAVPFLDPPSMLDKETCLHRHGEAMCQGVCISVCPVGQ